MFYFKINTSTIYFVYFRTFQLEEPQTSNPLSFGETANMEVLKAKALDIETSSTTLTASETEENIIQLLKDKSKTVSPTIAANKSQFRGKLALVTPQKR